LFKEFNSKQNSGCHGNQKKKLKKTSFRKPEELKYLYFKYQVCSNKCPGVKIGPAPGVIDFPYLYIVKT
jgi:hypothetical protein